MRRIYRDIFQQDCSVFAAFVEGAAQGIGSGL